MRWNSARTAISCRRKSSSSRAPSPTRWKASAASGPSCSEPTAAAVFAGVDAVLMLACGTSYYSGMVGATVARGGCRHTGAGRDRQRIPLSRQRAQSAMRWSSSFRSRARRRTRLSALKHAKRSAIRTRWRSATSRPARWCGRPRLAVLTRAGVEIGVASTKAFTTQLTALFLLTLTLAKLRGRLDRRRGGALAAGLAPPAGGHAGGAGARAADHRLGRALREKGARAVPRARACTTRSRWKAR